MCSFPVAIPGVGGSHGGEGGSGADSDVDIIMPDYRYEDIRSPTLFGEAGHCGYSICADGQNPPGGGILQVIASSVVNHGTISSR